MTLTALAFDGELIGIKAAVYSAVNQKDNGVFLTFQNALDILPVRPKRRKKYCNNWSSTKYKDKFLILHFLDYVGYELLLKHLMGPKEIIAMKFHDNIISKRFSTSMHMVDNFVNINNMSKAIFR